MDVHGGVPNGPITNPYLSHKPQYGDLNHTAQKCIVNIASTVPEMHFICTKDQWEVFGLLQEPINDFLPHLKLEGDKFSNSSCIFQIVHAFCPILCIFLSV